MIILGPLGQMIKNGKIDLKKYNKEISDQIVQNINRNQVGNGGFSLRSKKFLEYSASFNDCNNIDEDIFYAFITLKNLRIMA